MDYSNSGRRTLSYSGRYGGPLRCFKCLTRRHIRMNCPSSHDRSNCCLCCATKHASCPACEEEGRNARHRIGGWMCPTVLLVRKPQKKRGRSPPSSTSSEESLLELGSRFQWMRSFSPAPKDGNDPFKDHIGSYSKGDGIFPTVVNSPIKGLTSKKDNRENSSKLRKVGPSQDPKRRSQQKDTVFCLFSHQKEQSF